MILLTATTDLISVITDAAVTCDVHASYMDYTTVVTPGRQNTAISTATTTTVVSSPASSTQRNVKTLNIRNKAASTSVGVTVQFNQNATLYELHATTLKAGECLEYIEGIGFFLLTATAKLDTVVRVANDIVMSTAATLADVTGLTVNLKNAKFYAFESQLFHISAATTTGAQFGVNYSGTATLVIAANISGVTNSVTGGTISLGSATALNTVITAQTTGSSGITQTVLAGFINPSADGTFAIRGTAEVAANMTIKAGSWLLVRETDN
jgi:hypothetical protein